jgi:tetratricopeptide (TPR) repeat protein
VKTILATFLTILLLLPVTTFGEIQTITHTVKQPFGGSQSPDDARISAIAKAKREALEKAGTYIESLTVVKNSQVDKDEILALAAGVLKAEVVSQENYHTKDAFGIDVVVRVVVDTSVLESRVKKLLQDRNHLDQLNLVQQREKELLQKIVKLEEENRRFMEKGQSNEKLKKEFQGVSQEIIAFEWLVRATQLEVRGKFIDQEKAIEYFNDVIRFKPATFSFPPSWGQQIVAMAYFGRGTLYGRDLGQYQRSIDDFDQAILLDPDFRSAYISRGMSYANISQHQKAIADFNQAIRLNPDSADAYNNRGLDYIFSNNIREGCRDVQKACELGVCKGYEFAKGKGYCR